MNVKRARSLVACLSVFILFLALGLSRGEEPEYEMTTFQLVFLVEGDDADDSGGSASRDERVGRAQRGFVSKLLNAEVALIGGKIDAGGPLRGVAVLDVESNGRAREIFENAPEVSSGRLEAEVYTWWAAKEILRRPPDTEDRTVCYLGLLNRPANAPRYSEERLAEIQRGHLANIKKMADSGDLVIAGPVEDGGEFRGILVFRTTDRSRIESLVSEDPAIQAGRLELELYRWHVPRGSLPES